MQLVDIIWGVIGFLLTIMVFSYLIGDNPLFRIATHLFIGIASGYVTVLLLEQVLWPKLIQPLLAGSLGTRLLLLIPLALAILLFTKLSPQYGRLGNISLAFLVGSGAAIIIGGAIQGTLIPQSLAAINVFDFTSPGAMQSTILVHFLEGLFLLITTTASLLFFFYGEKPKTPWLHGPWQMIQAGRKVGEYFIAITLGAVYAGVMAASVAALVERVSSLWIFISHLMV
jgi:hypothetical protein